MLGSGVLSDRVDRRRLMIVGDMIRLVGDRHGRRCSRSPAPSRSRCWSGWWRCTAWGRRSSDRRSRRSCRASCPADLLVEANSLGQFVRPIAMTLVGPLIGGLLVGSVGAGWAFIADARTFAFSAADDPADPCAPDRAGAAEDDARSGSTRRRASDTSGSAPWIWAALAGAFVSLLCIWGPWETLVPFIVKNDLHGSATDLGLVFGAGGVGSVLAALIIGQRGGLPRKPLTILYLFWALGMLMTAGFGVVNTVWQAHDRGVRRRGLDHGPRRRVGDVAAAARPAGSAGPRVQPGLDGVDRRRAHLVRDRGAARGRVRRADHLDLGRPAGRGGHDRVHVHPRRAGSGARRLARAPPRLSPSTGKLPAHGVHAPRSARPGGQPPLPGHDELRTARLGGRQPRDHGRGGRARRQLLRHRERLRPAPRRRCHRGDHRAVVRQGRRTARQGRARHQGLRADGRLAERRPAVRAHDPQGVRGVAASGCVPTTSTSIRCTTSTATRRGTRSGRRWSCSCSRARSSTSARATSRDGTSRARTRSRARGTSWGWPRSRACTTSARGRSSSRCCPPSASTAWDSSPTARCRAACSPARLSKVEEGRRSSEYLQGEIQEHRDQLVRWEAVCAELGERPSDVALAWLLAQPGVTSPIIGPRTPDQLHASMRALEIRLGDDVLAKLDEIFPGPGGSAPEAYAW